MDYARMVEKAWRNVVKDALTETIENGLTGAHHFYITFITRFPGVELPEHLLARFPNDITIVLQHQFWDLEVDDDGFSVSLQFNNVPTRIAVPFSALTSFADPSADFALQFHPVLPEGFQLQTIDGKMEAAPSARDADDAPLQDESADVMVETAADDADGKPDEPKTGEVVSLDAFRKK